MPYQAARPEIAQTQTTKNDDSGSRPKRRLPVGNAQGTSSSNRSPLRTATMAAISPSALAPSAPALPTARTARFDREKKTAARPVEARSPTATRRVLNSR